MFVAKDGLGRRFVVAGLVAAVLVVTSGCGGRGPLPALGWLPVARVDPEVLAGRVWVLDAWREGEPADPEPEVTLRYADGRFTGKSGCNRYSAEVDRRAGRNAFVVETIASTRMMCPEPVSKMEARFLDLLAGAKAVELRGERLDVVYTTPDGQDGALGFHPATPRSDQ
jgi:heat shock protein HslJ